MIVTVFGIWHLGSVAAACLAKHYTTICVDPDKAVIDNIGIGKAPIFEPGLDDLLQAGISSGNLTSSHDIQKAVSSASIIWVTFDTPVNENDVADSNYVKAQIASIFPYLHRGTVVLISSQLPVGTTAEIEKMWDSFGGEDVHFAYLPENLQLGKAIDRFNNPDRIVAGTRHALDKEILATFLAPFSTNIVWMSVESAEMTKHAINAFLATSVTFINEIASIGEMYGVDAREVENGLKSDTRIGPHAYLKAGGPFAGGTLARDVTFLSNCASRQNIPVPLLNAIQPSNYFHKTWPYRKLYEMLVDLSGKTVAVLGLTYKAGTSTLRRSHAIELCQWLAERNVQVQAFDPAITEPMPGITLASSATEALRGADALVVATEWPQFRELSTQDFALMKTPVIIDMNRFLEKSLGTEAKLKYVAVGITQ